jgi:hypothetical protein
MKSFWVGCFIAVAVFGVLRLGHNDANAISPGLPGPPPFEVWDNTLSAVCKPLDACKSKLCSAHTLAECKFEKTAIDGANNRECHCVPEWYKTCQTKRHTGLPCVTHAAKCGEVEHETPSGQKYYTCEVIDPGMVHAGGPPVKDCKDFSLF